MDSRKITMDDVAEISGISKTTVSYILNGKNANFQISESTVRKVAETAIQLNYRTEDARKALANLEPDRLSVLVLTPWLYAQHSDFMVQLHKAFREAQATQAIEFVYMQYPAGQIGKVLRPMIFARYDAVFVSGSSKEDHLYLSRNSRNLRKIILLNRRVDGILSVSGNDENASSLLAKKICACTSYSHFLLVSDPDSWCNRYRMNGFLKGLSENGKEARILRVDPKQPEEVFSTLEEALGNDGMVFFTQYYPAACFLIRHPDLFPQRGLACYDVDQLISRFLPKQLTSLDPHISLMALEAVRLAKRLKEGLDTQSVVINASLLSGNTLSF